LAGPGVGRYRPVTGKRLWLCGTCDSSQEAEKLRTKFLGQVDGRKASRTRASLSALLDEWLPGTELGPNTRDNYTGLINRFIRPALGDLPLSRITPQRIERFYGELRRCRARCDGRPFVEHPQQAAHDCARAKCGPHECRPLAPSSVLVLHAILSGAFEAAVRWDWASVNVVRVARRPKVPPPQPDPPTPAQAAALVTAAWEQDVMWGTLVWLVMTTGMRRGEVLALRWRHVQFDRQLLEIRRNYVQRQGRKIEKDTKTHQMRRISLDHDTIGVLEEHRDRALHRLSAGVDLVTVSGRLGHGGGGTTTLRVYAAWVAASDQRAANVLGAKMPTRRTQQAVPTELS